MHTYTAITTSPTVTKYTEFSGHRAPVYALALSPDASVFYSADGNGAVARWDLSRPLADGTLLATLPASVYALCSLPERGHLLAAQNFMGLHLIDTVQKKVLHSVKFTENAIFDVAVSGGTVYVACADGLLHLLSLEGLVWQQCLRISEKSLRCIAVNPHTGHLAIGSSDCKLHILTAEGKRVSVAEGHANSVFTAAYMPESGKLLSGSRDAKIKLWDPGQGYALQETVAAHTFALNSLSLSHKADTFVTGSMDKTIKVWDKTTLRLLKVIDKARHGAHSASVNKVLYTEYNNLLLSCSDDQRIMAFGLHTEA